MAGDSAQAIHLKAGAQIDLLFDRDDEVITLFEIKYSEHPFSLPLPIAHFLSERGHGQEKLITPYELLAIS